MKEPSVSASQTPPDAPASPFQHLKDTWGQRNFAWYMTGAGISLFGVWAQRIAVGWLVWELTKSEFWLGLIAFADLFPTVVLTPLAGAIADRTNRLTMARISQVLAALQAFVLAWMTMTGRLTEPSDAWWLFGMTLFLGIVMAFATAARLSLVPNLLEPRYVPSALASDSAIYNLARIVGPMIAAMVIAGWGAGIAFLLNGFLLIVFVLCLIPVRILISETGRRPSSGVFSQLAEGIGYAVRHPGIGPVLIVIAAVALGIKPFLELLPALADEVFNRGVQGFAWLAAAGGAGAVVAAVWLALRGRIEGLTRIMLAALVVGVSGITLMSVTENIWVGLAGAFIAGFSITLSGTGAQTLMQNSVAGHMRGRVMSLYGVLHRGAPALGALAIGGASEFIGVQTALASGALVVCLLAMALVLPRRAVMAAALEKSSFKPAP